jgi:hypothetical protein
MKPDSVNGVKSLLAAGSIITTKGMFLSIIRFLKYILHYMVLFLSAFECEDGLHELSRLRMCAIFLVHVND